MKHILCPEHIFYLHGGILIKPYTNVYHYETECHAQEPGHYLKGQGHNWRLKHRLCLPTFSYIHGGIIITPQTNVHHHETECHAQEPDALLKGRGHTWRLKFKLKHTLCPEDISYMHGGILIIFHTNVQHYETECHEQEPEVPSSNVKVRL